MITESKLKEIEKDMIKLRGNCVYFHDIKCNVQTWLTAKNLEDSLKPKQEVDMLTKAFEFAKEIQGFQASVLASFCYQCPILMERTKHLRN